MREQTMTTATVLLRQGKREQIWQKYCGFLDLEIEAYMAIQRRLLEEQLPRLASCSLGKRLMQGREPRTLEEFRARVPFTTYRDYAPLLASRDDEPLPEKPVAWVHTSGRSGEYDYKWVPYTRRMFEIIGESTVAAFIMASAKRRGDVVLRPRMKFPYAVAPEPYISGLLVASLLEQIDFVSFPSIAESAAMDFQERIQSAFMSALNEGLDFFFGVSSILMRISSSFVDMGARRGSAPPMHLTARGLLRLSGAILKSRLQGRQLLPRDIWKVKGALCGGMDTSIFKAKVADSWGVEPLEGYASTELGIIAAQTWAREGLTFFPEPNFWEFITEKDYRSLMENPSYIPPSLLLNEVQPGSEYVLVGTSCHGGALVRYIVGDLIKIVSLGEPATGVRLPQMVFVSRIDDLIDVGGFTRLTEKTIWQAIEDSGVPYEEWTIRKEARGDQPVLHLYVEMRDGEGTPEDVREAVRTALKTLDPPYRDLEEMTGIQPLAVSLLSKGTFRRYFEERQAAGADPAHMKPPHINPSEKVIDKLLGMSAWKL